MKTNLPTYILVLSTLLFTACGGGGSSSPSGGTDIKTTYTVERGPLYDATVTDANGKTATQVSGTNKYDFTGTVVKPVKVVGGWIDVNGDGVKDSGDVESEIELLSYEDGVVTPITSALAESDPAKREALISAMASEYGISKSALLDLPSKSQNVAVLANAIYNDAKENNLTRFNPTQYHTDFVTNSVSGTLATNLRSKFTSYTAIATSSDGMTNGKFDAKKLEKAIIDSNPSYYNYVQIAGGNSGNTSGGGNSNNQGSSSNLVLSDMNTTSNWIVIMAPYPDTYTIPVFGGGETIIQRYDGYKDLTNAQGVQYIDKYLTDLVSGYTLNNTISTQALNANEFDRLNVATKNAKVKSLIHSNGGKVLLIEYTPHPDDMANAEAVKPLKAHIKEMEDNSSAHYFFHTSETLTFKSKTYKTVKSPITGKIWLDRNIGADNRCSDGIVYDVPNDDFNSSDCQGWNFQWGRYADGHQLENASEMPWGNSSVDPNRERLKLYNVEFESEYIVTTQISGLDGDYLGEQAGSYTSEASSISKEYDLNGSIRQARWKATDGSSVCPLGFRVATATELYNELHFRNEVLKHCPGFKTPVDAQGDAPDCAYNDTLRLYGSASNISLWTSDTVADITFGKKAHGFESELNTGNINILSNVANRSFSRIDASPIRCIQE
jgi:hypothetical protein